MVVGPAVGFREGPNAESEHASDRAVYQPRKDSRAGQAAARRVSLAGMRSDQGHAKQASLGVREQRGEQMASKAGRNEDKQVDEATVQLPTTFDCPSGDLKLIAYGVSPKTREPYSNLHVLHGPSTAATSHDWFPVREGQHATPWPW